MKQTCDRVEFSPGHSNMARLCSDLAEDLIGIVVQYSGISGNIAFELPILRKSLFSYGAGVHVDPSRACFINKPRKYSQIHCFRKEM